MGILLIRVRKRVKTLTSFNKHGHEESTFLSGEMHFPKVYFE